MLVTSYNNTKYDLRELGGPEESWVADGTFFEIDIETQKVLFEWRAIDHVNLRASRFGFNGPGGHSERVPWVSQPKNAPITRGTMSSDAL